MRGYWSMHCWNGLSEAQQQRLLEHGVLPFGFRPEGWCQRPAEAEVTTMYDAAPGPRFYCLPCLIAYVTGVTVEQDSEPGTL